MFYILFKRNQTYILKYTIGKNDKILLSIIFMDWNLGLRDWDNYFPIEST